MVKPHSEWKEAQNHDIQVYSKRQTYADMERAKTILNQFGKNLEDIKQKTILSIGAGMGIIHSLDFKCKNIALDPLTIYNSKKLKESHADLVTGIGEDLPFNDDSIDFVYSYNVLDHCIDPGKVIKEASRVTRPGGELLLEINTYEVPKIIRESIIAQLDTEHPHHFSSAEVRSLVRTKGYSIKRENIINRLELLKNPTIRRIGAIPFRMRRCFITAEV